MQFIALYRSKKTLSVHSQSVLRRLLWAFLSVVLVCINACTSTVEPEPDALDTTPYLLRVPQGFPPPPIPEGNPLTVKKVELGRRLFFDPVLSRNGTMACASCHVPSRAFSDGLRFSVGIDNQRGVRNAPTLTNVAYNTSYFWHGGSQTLEAQALSVINNQAELDGNFDEIIRRLEANTDYKTLFRQAFGKAPDFLAILDALASFERTLLSGNSPYDRYQRGDAAALTASELRGKALFFSARTQCASCHARFNFTTFAFENNGLYAEYSDAGRYEMTFNMADWGKFKVPTLRNVSVTAPYMHDGSLASLEDVVDHYNNGGKSSPNQSSRVKPLGLTPDEQQDLVNFLKALTDEEFLRP
jgi:cytochrome c peroxidase